MHSKPKLPETEYLTPVAGLSNDIQGVEPFVGVAKNRPPIWGWIFAVICMIPVIGIVPLTLAVVSVIGAIACIFASFNALPATVRVILCVLIAAGTWFVHMSYHLKQIFETVSQTY